MTMTVPSPNLTSEEAAAVERAKVAYEKWRKSRRKWPTFDQMQAVPYGAVVVIVKFGWPPLVVKHGRVKVVGNRR